MPYTTMPIVGAFFRPPAKLLLAHLALGVPLLLVAEPDNPYDPNAVAIWLRSADIPVASHESLDEALPQVGLSLAQVLSQELWHLGYIPKEMAAELKAAGVITNDGEPMPVTFALNAKGDPRVRFFAPVL